jgi:hypothetical protein
MRAAGRASGEHYGSQGMLPMIPGTDGTGRTADGTQGLLRRCPPPVRSHGPAGRRPVLLPLPERLDEITAAAIVTPGNGAWLALTRQAAPAAR